MFTLRRSRQVVESLARRFMNSAIPGVLLPTSDSHTDIARVDFHAVTETANSFGSNEGAAGAEKAIQNDVAARGAIHDGISNERYRFHRGMRVQEVAFIPCLEKAD